MPAVSVVVPSHGRPLRLRWLLNALEEQTLPPDSWEVVVVHDDADEEAERLLRAHPLAAAGRLRHRRLPPGTGSAPRQRNAGWRAARTPLVAFTDDDCRPDPEWLERLLAAASRSAGAIVQGATRPDPDEAELLAAPRARTITVHPPGPYLETCNVLYPRALLARLGGFEERLRAGDDTDLALRARAAGEQVVAAPDALVHHAVEALSLPGMVRLTLKWRDLPLVVRRHPSVRRGLPLGVVWRSSHGWLALAALGAARAAQGSRAGGLLALPYLRYGLARRGRHARGRLRAAAELPGHTVVELAEIVALAYGSARHRTLFL